MIDDYNPRKSQLNELASKPYFIEIIFKENKTTKKTLRKDLVSLIIVNEIGDNAHLIYFINMLRKKGS